MIARRSDSDARSCGHGVIGSHVRLRIWCREAWGFESLCPHKVFENEQRKLLVFLYLVPTKCHAPPVAPRTTCLRWVAMCHVAMQLWVCAESNYLCKHRVTLNTHPQSMIARTSLPFSVASRLLRTFESQAVQPWKVSPPIYFGLLSLCWTQFESRVCSPNCCMILSLVWIVFLQPLNKLYNLIETIYNSSIICQSVAQKATVIWQSLFCVQRDSHWLWWLGRLVCSHSIG